MAKLNNSEKKDTVSFEIMTDSISWEHPKVCVNLQTDVR